MTQNRNDSRYYWNDSDSKRLEILIGEGKTPMEVAEIMGIYIKNVRNRATVMGLKWLRMDRARSRAGREKMDEKAKKTQGVKPIKTYTDPDTGATVRVFPTGWASGTIVNEMGFRL